MRIDRGAAWRSPKDRDIEKVAELIRTVKALGLETCATGRPYLPPGAAYYPER